MSPDGPVRFRVAALDLGINGARRPGWPRAVSRSPCSRRRRRPSELLAAGPTGSSSPTAPAIRRPPITPVAAAAGVLDARRAALRHLLRQPGARPGARLRHIQARLRPPRHQPAGAGPGDRQGRGHQPQPRLRGRRAARPDQRNALRRASKSATSPQRRRRRRPAAAGPCRPSRCSTTRRPRPARTMPTACSTGSST